MNNKRKPTDFEQKVYDACAKIPKGKVSTYSEIARAIGRPNATRAVGNALNKNPFPPDKVPCHRVVKNDGSIGGFAHGPKNKIKLLKSEGIEFKTVSGKVEDKFRKNLYCL
ncbi:MGMT family protein [Candidatus Micrarchaeota archaeon]|nr:MGMT family protein [Candidatus Micrarchaeota archaeon]